MPVLKRLFTALLPYEPNTRNKIEAPFLCNTIEARVALVKAIAYFHLYTKIMTDGNATHHNQEPHRSFAVLEKIRVDFLTCLFEELEPLIRVRRHVLEQTLGLEPLEIPTEDTRLRHALTLHEKYDGPKGAKRAKPKMGNEKNNREQFEKSQTGRERDYKKFLRYLSGIPTPLVPYSVQVTKSENLLKTWIKEVDMNGVNLELWTRYFEEIAPETLVDEKTTEQGIARALTKAHMILNDQSMNSNGPLIPGAPATHFYSRPLILGDSIFSLEPLIDVFMHEPLVIEHEKQREVLHPFLFDFIKDSATHKECASLAHSHEELTYMENHEDRWWCVFTGMPIKTPYEGLYTTYFFPKHPPITLVVSYAHFEVQSLNIQCVLEGTEPPASACNAFETVYATYVTCKDEFKARCKSKGSIFSLVQVAPPPAFRAPDSDFTAAPFDQDPSVEFEFELEHDNMQANRLKALLQPKDGQGSASMTPLPLEPTRSASAPDMFSASTSATRTEALAAKPEPVRAPVPQTVSQPPPPPKNVNSTLMQSLHRGMASSAQQQQQGAKKRGLASAKEPNAKRAATDAKIKEAEFARQFYNHLGIALTNIGQALLGNSTGKNNGFASLTADVLYSMAAVNAEEPEDGRDICAEDSEDEAKMEIIKRIEDEEAHEQMKENYEEYSPEDAHDYIVKLPRFDKPISVTAWTDPARVPDKFCVVPANLSYVPSLIMYSLKRNKISEQTIAKFISTCKEITASADNKADFVETWFSSKDEFKREFFYAAAQLRSIMLQVVYPIGYLQKVEKSGGLKLTLEKDDYENWPDSLWYLEENYVSFFKMILTNADMPVYTKIGRNAEGNSMPKLGSGKAAVEAWIQRTYKRLRPTTRQLLTFFFRLADDSENVEHDSKDDFESDNSEDDEGDEDSGEYQDKGDDREASGNDGNQSGDDDDEDEDKIEDEKGEKTLSDEIADDDDEDE